MNYPIIDGHNDLLYVVQYPEITGGRDFFKRNVSGHFDLPRAREGGFAGGFFAVYVPADPENRKPAGFSNTIHTEEGYETPLDTAVNPTFALNEALALVATLYRLERESAGGLSVVRTAAEIEDCIESNTVAAILHFEGAEPIDPDLESLPFFYEKGLRSLGIVWSRPNAFGHGVPFRYPHSPDTGDGLTSAGEALVRACNDLHIMLDLAHLNEKGFWDVARLSNAPLVSTHTAAHAICPSTRNITDKQLDAIKESGGMVGLNFNVRDVRADGRETLDTPLSHYVRQMDYLVERLGIDHVGFGSDFDGALISGEIKDVAGLPRLIAALEDAGYDEASLRKITHENWLNLLRRTWGG